MKFSYNWLQNYFEEKLPEPEKLAEVIIFHAFEVEEIEKVNQDTIFEIKVLPDRAHDCLSHYGLAKEISAILNLPIRSSVDALAQVLGSLGPPPQPDHSSKYSTGDLKIKIENQNCRRYMGRIVRNIKVRPSPDWLKEKLENIGQKSINNIVDIANFIMFDLGQPIHCFDLDKLASPEIIIRQAQKGEKIITLDKKEVNLDESVLIIADKKDPLAIAGIKGGTKAEVDLNTKNIVIEVANFEPVNIRKTARKINLLTDAVKRYENELTPELTTSVMQAISDLVSKLAGGDFEKIIDIYPKKPEQKNVFVSVDYINKRLGTNFNKEEIENVWQRLNFEYEEEGDNFKILIPTGRLDITGPHDLVEDVIKILGYDRIKEILPKINWQPGNNEEFSKIVWAKSKMLQEGYSEVMTYTFQDKGEVEVLASASDKKFLRTNLTDGLQESLKLNQLNMPLLQTNEIKIFEIGTVFKKSGEEMHIAWNEKNQIKEMTLDEYCKNQETSFEQKHTDSVSATKFKPWSIYPFISRDIAVWLPEKEDPAKLEKILRENGTELLVREPYLFDSFTKPASTAGEEGRTSYAFRLVFQSYDRTLKGEEIDQIMTNITNKIKEKNDWQIR